MILTWKISAYVFPIVVLLPGIPVSSIIIRYNLMKSNLVKRRMANFLSVVLPWIVCLPFYVRLFPLLSILIFVFRKAFAFFVFLGFRVINLFLQTGSGFLNFINWVSLFVNGAINFIIPFWLYLLSYKLKAKYPPTAAQMVRDFIVLNSLNNIFRTEEDFQGHADVAREINKENGKILHLCFDCTHYCRYFLRILGGLRPQLNHIGTLYFTAYVI